MSIHGQRQPESTSRPSGLHTNLDPSEAEADLRARLAVIDLHAPEGAAPPLVSPTGQPTSDSERQSKIHSARVATGAQRVRNGRVTTSISARSFGWSWLRAGKYRNRPGLVGRCEASTASRRPAASSRAATRSALYARPSP